MPTAGIALNISAVQAGKWVVRIYPMVNNKPCPSTVEHNEFIKVKMVHGNGTVIHDETAINENGYVEFDGTIDGSFTDIIKIRYQIFVYYRREQLTKSVWCDIELGYYQFDKGLDSNGVGESTWERWINLIWRNVDAGLPWYTTIPYVWWWGYDQHRFANELIDHIGTSEPLWESTAPSLHNLVLSVCPIDGTLLGFTTPGQNIKCPNDGFVSAWTRQIVNINLLAEK